MNHSPYSAESSQGWHSPGPPPSAPTEYQLANVPHTSQGYPTMPVTSHSHVNPTWDSSPTDTSAWGVKYNQRAVQGSEPASKPPLPVGPTFLLTAFHLNIELICPSTLSAKASSSNTRPAYFARGKVAFVSPIIHNNRGACLPTTCSVRPCLCTAVARISSASTAERANFDTVPPRA